MFKIILAGGSGFLGRHLASALHASTHEVVVLTRSPEDWRGPGRAVAWDGKTVGSWADEWVGASAIVNLTGQNVDCRWTAENKRRFLDSRVDSVHAIQSALAIHPVPVWIQFSGSNLFGDMPGPCAESSPPGRTYLAQLCQVWEAAVHVPRSTRLCVLRPGMVMGHDGGAWVKLYRFTRLGLGAAASHGRQKISWIHVDDMVAMVMTALEDDRWNGPINACAPESVSNAQLMRVMREACHRPWLPPVPAWMMHPMMRLLGTSATLVLESCHMQPARALELHFRWRYPALGSAIADLIGKVQSQKH